MRRLMAAAIAAAALVAVPTSANADHVQYSRECGGILDTECNGWVCPTDCWHYDCIVWIDPLHDETLARCIGNPID